MRLLVVVGYGDRVAGLVEGHVRLFGVEGVGLDVAREDCV